MNSATDSMVLSLSTRVRGAESPLDLVGFAFTTRGAAIFLRGGAYMRRRCRRFFSEGVFFFIFRCL